MLDHQAGQSSTAAHGDVNAWTDDSQLLSSADAATELSFKDDPSLQYVGRALKTVIMDPLVLKRSWQRLIAARRTPAESLLPTPVHQIDAHEEALLSLKPSERVRVRSLAKIQVPIEEDNRCERLVYMPLATSKSRGGTCLVHKCIDGSLDERTWRLLKAKNVVVIDEYTSNLHVTPRWVEPDATARASCFGKKPGRREPSDCGSDDCRRRWAIIEELC